MIIAISGSVGSGKTSLAKELSKRLNFKLISLNDIALKFKTNDVKELHTFDFDIDKLVIYTNKIISECKDKNTNLILEGHFAHFLDSRLIDILFIINRSLPNLKKEYLKRKYNKQKIKDNLEVESFNLCFYEALEENFLEEEQVFCFDNNSTLEKLVDKVIFKIGLHPK